MTLRRSYLENLQKAANSCVLQFKWSFEQAQSCTNSDITALFESSEFKQHQEQETEKFKTLLKTIARSR